MTEPEQKPKPDREAVQEAEELAKQLWDDIQLICSGPGTFTHEQTDGYVVARIAQAFAEVIHQRNAAFFHIGEVWMERNQMARRLEDAAAEIKNLLVLLGQGPPPHTEA